MGQPLFVEAVDQYEQQADAASVGHVPNALWIGQDRRTDTGAFWAHLVRQAGAEAVTHTPTSASQRNLKSP